MQDTATRMRHLSWIMQHQMGDQSLERDPAHEAEYGKSIRVTRTWNRDDENEWGEAVLWIQDQFKRLRLILEEHERGLNETHGSE